MIEQTPLMRASDAGKLEVVDILLDHSLVPLDFKDKEGMSALAKAAHRGHADIVESLLNVGADISVIDTLGRNCLHIAVAAGHLDVVECLLKHHMPLPNPLPNLPPNSRHKGCLADLYTDAMTSTIAIDNPLRLVEPPLFDNPPLFFKTLLKALSLTADILASEAFAKWLTSLGIRQTVVASVASSFDDLSQVWGVLATPGKTEPTAAQKLNYCTHVLSRLIVTAPDQQISAHYLQAGLSPAGMARLLQIALGQRDKIAELASEGAAQLATKRFNQLLPSCFAKTGPDFHIDVDSLKTSMAAAGFIPPLINLLVNSWGAAVEQLATTPLAMPQTRSLTEMRMFIDDHVTTKGAELFALEILRQLDSRDLVVQWRATLSEVNTEGLFALFDDHCRQLREYCMQLRQGGD